MSWMESNTLRVAIIDMYEGVANQGMRGIREILNMFAEYNNLTVIRDEFDIRRNAIVPGLDYDVYISTGGPGSPLDSEGSEWENNYFDWIERILKYNDNEANVVKKPVFFICHSFQLATRFFKIGTVDKRRSTSFGIFPVHLMGPGTEEQVFEGLKDPFYVVDSRDYQVVAPDHNRIRDIGATILAIEKARPHVPLERAIMAVRFNEHMIGTQFHPEADPVGMSIHLNTEERKKTVVENFGLAKWESMIEHLNDPDKIRNTYSHILPNFLAMAVSRLTPAEVITN